jgi:1,4-dihydroxy-2-naphthoate octaprenyltransferase
MFDDKCLLQGFFLFYVVCLMCSVILMCADTHSPVVLLLFSLLFYSHVKLAQRLSSP